MVADGRFGRRPEVRGDFPSVGNLANAVIRCCHKRAIFNYSFNRFLDWQFDAKRTVAQEATRVIPVRTGRLWQAGGKTNARCVNFE